jgi:hypothetical protein
MTDKYYMVSRNEMRQKRNQMLHMMDEYGKTYCQTENVRRKNKVSFIEITDIQGRPICKSCRAVKEEQENPIVDYLTAAFIATIGPA